MGLKQTLNHKEWSGVHYDDVKTPTWTTRHPDFSYLFGVETGGRHSRVRPLSHLLDPCRVETSPAQV